MVFAKENCTQEFLDAGQYKKNGILRYERIFGRTWLSTGGETTTKSFMDKLTLKPGMKVLDIGCGTGGSAFYMADKYGVEVLGVDLSANMLAIANDHMPLFSQQVQNRVRFELVDILKEDYADNSFDIVYSRDAIMHIADKEDLYRKVYKWMKPGGQLLVSEYVHGPLYPNHSAEYVAYVKKRGYQFVTVPQYGHVLRKVGFTNVEAVDKTDYFKKILKMELEKFKPTKKEFVKDFSLEDYNEIVDGWEVKLGRVDNGDQGWGLFIGAKEA